MKRATSPTLKSVRAGQLCSGCGLCASVSNGAVEMQVEPPGYARPRQLRPLDDHRESLIAYACPGAVVEAWAADGVVDPYWGPWRLVATGYAADARLRFQASSGGALSALLVHALRVGLVDRVLHIAADPVNPTRNVEAVSKTFEDVLARSGSRYSSSSPLVEIESQLAAGGRFAFVGKPCDVSALRRLAHRDPRVERHVPIALSFFCAGVPSHAAAGRILTALDVKSQDVASFRYRGEGWPGNAKATLLNGGFAQMSYAQSWGGILSKEVQFRCKICPDAVGGVADVACADAWYGDDEGYPTFEEVEGRSLIMARTAVGERLVASAVEAGDLVVEPLGIEQVARMQPGQARRKRLVRARTWALAASLQPTPIMRGNFVNEAARRAGFVEQLRSFVGALRRIVVGRR